MTDDPSVRVAAAFARQAVAPPAHLCRACVEILQVSGAGITLMSKRSSGPVCASNDRTGVLEELQFTLGEGPCQDAFVDDVPVAEPDLANAPTGRWPNFAPPALEACARAVFAFPLRSGRDNFGVLTLYQFRAGDLTADQAADSLVVAEVLSQAMLAGGSSTTSGLPAALDGAGSHRAEVHQASGMLSVQLGISVPDALARLRAHAFVVDRTVTAVARDIVARRYRLGDEEEGDSRAR